MEAAGATGVPMAFGVLTTNRWSRRGAGRRRPRQQGARGGGRGDRDGGARSRTLTSASRARRCNGTMREATARHRAREAALQMLYQWEVGRTDVRATRSQTFLAGAVAGRGAAVRRASRTFAPTLVRGDDRARVDDARSADRRDRRALAHRADEGDRSADPAAGGLRAPAPSRRRRRRSSSTKRSSWRAPSAPTSRSQFINGMLDGVRKKLGRE